MTNKKLITATAKKIRKITGLDLPRSIKLAKLYIKNDPKFLTVLSDLGFKYQLDIDTDPFLDGVITGYVYVTSPKGNTVKLKYYDGVVID